MIQTGETNAPITVNRQEGAMGQTPDRTIDDWQETSGAVTAEVEKLQKHLDAERQHVQTLNADLAAKQCEVGGSEQCEVSGICLLCQDEKDRGRDRWGGCQTVRGE